MPADFIVEYSKNSKAAGTAWARSGCRSTAFKHHAQLARENKVLT